MKNWDNKELNYIRKFWTSLLLSICLILLLFISAISAQDYVRWGLPDGAEMRLGKGRINEVEFSPNGKYFAVASTIGIWIYDAYTGDELSLLSDEGLNTRSISFSPDGSMLAYGSYDKYIRIYDTTNWEIIKRFQTGNVNVSTVIFNPAGTILVSANSDNTATLWDVKSGTPLNTIEGHTRTISSMAFSPDGQTFVTGSWDQSIRLWDVKTGIQKNTYTKHTDGISSIIFFPDGRTFAGVGFNQNGTHIWDIETGNYLGEPEQPISSISTFSPDGLKMAIATDNELRIWDVENGKYQFQLTGHLYRISEIAFSPNGRILITAGDGELHLWDVVKGIQWKSISGHNTYVFGLAISPDNEIIAVGSTKEIRLWETDTGLLKNTLYEPDWGNGSMAFNPDGSLLASETGWRIRLWNIDDGTHHATLKGFLGNSASGYGIVSVKFSPDGRYLATGSSQSTIQLWNLGRIHKGTLTGHTDGIRSIAFSYDSRTLATASKDQTIRLWDVDNETHIKTLSGHTDEVLSVAFSPDASIIASGSADETVILWNTGTGEILHILTGHTSHVSYLAFSVDGRTLASAGYYENKILLWDVATGEKLPSITGHTSGISNLAFTNDGNSFVSLSSDGTALIWDWTQRDIKREPQYTLEDVNRDGIVDIQDLIYVASQFGTTDDENTADVNQDGIVDIADIVLIAKVLENENAAPQKTANTTNLLSIEQIKIWIDQAKKHSNTSIEFQKGIAILEHLLTSLTPKNSALLSNYPNPFNPETWIPYQLAKPADVRISIFSFDGTLVRLLNIGNQSEGMYLNRNDSAYWDGKNELGESVASGIYFYTLSAGDFSATRRMVIQK
ncbi:PD40 domain-containing protein [Candidatus Poribacteria bacterium]|nr:PD40 domain-containing protein [Candidatus Poribacteria bacterium]